MLDKQDLQAIADLLDNKLEEKLEPIRTDIKNLKADVAELKADVAELKADVAELKADVAELKADVAVLKEEVAVLKTDVAILKEEVAKLKHDVTDLQNSQVRLESRMNEIDQRTLKTQLSVETSLNKCIIALSDGFKMNVDTFRTKNFDRIEYDADVAMLTAKENAKSIIELRAEITALKQIMLEQQTAA